MSFWKILGGVAVGGVAGVGSIVMLPVFGAIGAATAVGIGVGAGVGALLGGGAGAAIDDAFTDVSRQKTKAEEAAARAMHATEVMAAKLKAAAERYASYKKFEEFVVAISAVGFSVASASGVLNPVAHRDIVEFVSGISSSVLPEPVNNLIADLAAKPPSFNTAMSYLDQLDPKRSDTELANLVEGIIDVVSVPGGTMNEAAPAWRSAWRGHRAA